MLDRAVQAASVDGLDALSFGGLAAVAPVNKSGIAGLFGSKEGLQLAVVEHARQTFVAAVITPAREAAPGLPRLWEIVRRWVEYSRSRVFTGGCFFRAVEPEFDAREGPVRDAIVEAQQDWDGYLRHHAEVAAAAGQLDPTTDAQQVVFELTALLGGANDRSVLLGDGAAYDRAVLAIRAALRSHGADLGVLRD